MPLATHSAEKAFSDDISKQTRVNVPLKHSKKTHNFGTKEINFLLCATLKNEARLEVIKFLKQTF